MIAPIRAAFLGDTHLAQTLRRAAELRGIAPAEGPQPNLIFIARDITEHSALEEVNADVERVVCGEAPQALIIASQVPPGYARRLRERSFAFPIFTQVDTIIMRQALARASAPEQFIIGCADPEAPLPLAYQEYLLAHEAPVRQMSYESAEVAKLAINYMLMKQIEAANDLAVVARIVGADYADVRAAMMGDARIGPHAYLRPGKTNQHLNRDIATVRALLEGMRYG